MWLELKGNFACKCEHGLSVLSVAGVVEEIIFETQTLKLSDANEYKRDAYFINGLTDFTCVIREHIKVENSKMIRIRSLDHDNLQELEFHHFPPGSAIALR